MSRPDRETTTRLLERWTAGEGDALDELLPVVYEELRVLARTYLRRQRREHTPETRALVHEAFLRLVDQDCIRWSERTHFYAIAARSMRRILVEHARRRGDQKRRGGAEGLPFEEALQIGDVRPADLLALDDLLSVLAEIDPDKSRLVELRFYGGLTDGEIAEILGVSVATVDRQWRLARAWLDDASKR